MANVTFLPNTDAKLLAWSANFSSLITAGAVSYGLTTGQATAYAALHSSFSTALAACEPSVRTKAAVSTKNAARTALKNNARLLASLVNGTASVTNAQKLTLGLTVKSKPTPVPVPSDSPSIDILQRSGTTVQIKLHDGTGTGRGRPVGVAGASVFSYVGPTAPTDMTDFHFEGNTTRTIIEVQFAGTLAPGTVVWFTAFWYNPRAQSGPGCSPVSAILAGGGMTMAA